MRLPTALSAAVLVAAALAEGALAQTPIVPSTALAGAMLAQAPVVAPVVPPAVPAPTAPAPTDPPAATPPPDWRGVFSIVTENDLFAAHNVDRHYTNGIRFGWLSADQEQWARIREFGTYLPMLDSSKSLRVGWALGHNLYTPENKRVSTPILTDRPYAAWLYGAVSLQSESKTRLDTVELDLGMVGPAAFGEPVQDTWHGFIGVDAAHGWDNQLKNEPGFALLFERKWRLGWEFPLAGGYGFDVIPHIAGSVGNVFTYGATGFVARFGEDLLDDFGPPRIRPALPGSGSFRSRDSFGWYVFAGAEGRAVARDIFLDGNTFANSQSVSKKWLVGDFQAGVAVVFESVRVTYTQVMRTREFEGQRANDFFGSLSLSMKF